MLVPPKIVECRISGMPNMLGDPPPEVRVKFAGDDRESVLFNYFPDELEFSSEEFVGLTREEALALYAKRDLAHLRGGA